jgi:predicted nucleotidyltransferase
LTQLARRLGADPGTVQREVTRLERAGILRTERVGRTRIVRPDETSPIYNELYALLGKTLGPAPLLEEALASVAGIRRAYIFGSWARRYRGEAGELPRDVDLLVVGSANPDAVYQAARAVEDRLGVAINPIVVSDDEWRRPQGLARVQREPLVELNVDHDDDC